MIKSILIAIIGQRIRHEITRWLYSLPIERQESAKVLIQDLDDWLSASSSRTTRTIAALIFRGTA